MKEDFNLHPMLKFFLLLLQLRLLLLDPRTLLQTGDQN